jgi:hypothetical protein
MYTAKAYIEPQLLDDAINEIRQTLGPDVVQLRYSVEDDFTGAPAIFFRVVLSDRASQRDRLGTAAGQVRSEIERLLRPRRNWGVLTFFNFRSHSEQLKMQDPDWA